MEARREVPHYTVEDYLQWEGDWELWHGAAVAVAPSPLPHQDVAGNLYAQLRSSVGAAGCKCRVYYEVDWHVAEEGLRYRHFTVAAQNRLRHHRWPGNLLELKNLVQRVLLLGGPTDVEVPEIDRTLGLAPGDDTMIPLRHDLPLREARSDFERRYLLHCLAAVRGNMGELARHAGMERTHLYRKLRSLEIDLERVRDEPRGDASR